MRIKVMMILLLTIISFNVKAQDSELSNLVSQTNSECPISMGAAGEIVSISYENGCVIYRCDINDGMVDIDALKSKPDIMKEGVLSTYRNASGETRHFLEMLNKDNASMKFIYKNKGDGNVASFTISSEELKEAASSTASKDPVEALRKYTELSNIQLPIKIEKGLYLQKYSLEDAYTVVLYSMDESMYSIDKLNENRASLKTQQKKELLLTNDLSVRTFLNTVKNAKYGLIYRYIGNLSGKKCDIVFTPKEVSEM